MRVKLSNGRAKAKAVNAQLGEIYMLHDRFVNGTRDERERVIASPSVGMGRTARRGWATQLGKVMRETAFHFCERFDCMWHGTLAFQLASFGASVDPMSSSCSQDKRHGMHATWA